MSVLSGMTVYVASFSSLLDSTKMSNESISFITVPHLISSAFWCDMAFIEPMHRNKPNITYLLTNCYTRQRSFLLLTKYCSPWTNDSWLPQEVLEPTTPPLYHQPPCPTFCSRIYNFKRLRMSWLGYSAYLIHHSPSFHHLLDLHVYQQPGGVTISIICRSSIKA